MLAPETGFFFAFAMIFKKARRTGVFLAIILANFLQNAGRAENIYGVTAVDSQSTSPGLSLVSFDSATPGAITPVGAFSGLLAGQNLRSIDFRPATGQLYAVSSNNNSSLGQLYTVNLANAALTAVGSTFSLGNNDAVSLEIDFNPVVDRIRLVTRSPSQNNNFRINPDTGEVISVDTNLAYNPADPQDDKVNLNVSAIAYSNNNPGATSTTLYGFEYQYDVLVTIGGIDGVPSPNGGVLNTVFRSPVAVTGNAGIGLDFSGATGMLYITHDNPAKNSMTLSTIDPTTGAETVVGGYGPGVFVVDIAVQPVPEPQTIALCAFASVLFLLRLRRSSLRSKKSNPF